MKKKHFGIIIFFIMVISACSNNSDELEGQTFNVFSWSPDITSEDISSDNFSPSSGLKFSFNTGSEVEIESGGKTLEGTYNLEDNTLNIELEDDNDESSLVLEVEEFKQNENNEDLYTGSVTKLDSENSDNSRISSNFSLDEYLGFYKVD